MVLDSLDQPLEQLSKRARVAERRMGDGGQHELLGARALLVKAGTRFPVLPFPPPVGPLEPSEPTRFSVEHHREGTEPRPLSAGRNQSLLHPVGKDVPNPSEQGFLVEDRLGRVAPLPEGAAPADKRAHLLRDVGQEMLHELGDVAAWSSDEKVNVIRGKHERHHLDSVQPRGPSQYTAEDLIRPFRRTEKQPPLQATDGQEVWNFRLIHSNWSCQAAPQFRRGDSEHESRQQGARHLARAPHTPGRAASTSAMKRRRFRPRTRSMRERGCPRRRRSAVSFHRSVTSRMPEGSGTRPSKSLPRQTASSPATLTACSRWSATASSRRLPR